MGRNYAPRATWASGRPCRVCSGHVAGGLILHGPRLEPSCWVQTVLFYILFLAVLLGVVLCFLDLH